MTSPLQANMMGNGHDVAPPINGHNTQPIADHNDLEQGRPNKEATSLDDHVTTNSSPENDAHLTAHARRVVRRLIIKNHIISFIGEFIGTVLFMFFALGGTNVANIPATTVTGDTTTAAVDASAEVTVLNTSSLLYIALAFGFSLAICAWIFFRVSGGLFNPAISFGLALVGVITWFRAALLTIAQCLGAITGAALIQVVLPGDLYVVTRLGSGTSTVQGLFLECFCTTLLMLAVLFLAAEKSRATFLAPIGIGLALFIAEMVSVLYTGGALNPARALGPNVVVRKFSSYHWIYWLGPAMGAALAAAIYKGLKLLHFETVVPDQDGDGQQQRLIAEASQGTGVGGSKGTPLTSLAA